MSHIELDGIKFYSTTRSRYFYADFGKKKKGLHRYVWEKHYGEIPEGCAIHHKDENVLNNSIENLVLMKRGEHQRMHMKEKMENPEYYKKLVTDLESIRSKASEWHKSEEGKWRHKKNYLTGLANARTHKHICAMCGIEFESKRVKKSRFCNHNCSQKYYYYQRKSK